MSELNNNQNFFSYVKDWINDNPGKAIGVGIGFALAIIFFIFGVWKTILIAIFMGIGYLLGRSRDENVSIMDEINRFFKRGNRE